MSKAWTDWQAAYVWLCSRRRHAPPNADVWHLRHHWPNRGTALLRSVLAGDYRLSAMQLHRRGHTRWVQWSAQDALVLKWVALQVAERLPRHACCAHLKGHGGGRVSVALAWQALCSGAYAFVYRTDIRGYYRHIRKGQVLALVERHVADPICVDLIAQYLHYSVEDGGEFHTPEHGICRGCALSPLIGAGIAPRALENHRQRRARLYELGRARGLSPAAAEARVRTYEARWNSWAQGILPL
ncbi:hypothetical protein [Zobellella sp. DQSA1]|uniref:hypothetical protein n=1 Tax=Zobellella sp. DQSA1 TaxID=3342386 RepID=UPI0035C00A97